MQPGPVCRFDRNMNIKPPSSFEPRRQAGRRNLRVPVAFAALFALGWSVALAQSGYHLAQIVWVVIGEAAGAAPNEPVRAGRHLFMAKELADFTLKNVDVARVDAQPEIVELTVGERFCVTSLRLSAFTAAGGIVKGSPMTISVRQDHKEPMGLDRSRKDICVKGVSAGEYPIRFSSLLPAKDGTSRGAQVFIRVRDATAQINPYVLPTRANLSSYRRTQGSVD